MKKVKEFLENKIENNSSLIVSCSGGPDSMCLLQLICDIKDKKNLNVICAHVNHGVRDESEEEKIFVENFCKKNNIVFELYTIEKYKGNFHNDARVLRYNFLSDILKKYDSKVILTAHHGDDLIETILMRISRGSNLSGYIGFKVINKLSTHKVLRPLIYTTKENIINYNNINGIEYRLDKTNESLEYTRNKYRHLVLPNLKKIDENIHLKFLKFSEKINEYDDFVKKYIMNKKLIEGNYINLINYKEEDEFIQKKSIELFISNLQQTEEFYVTDNIIFEIEKVINSDKGRANINLPNNFIGRKENKKFYIEKIK